MQRNLWLAAGLVVLLIVITGLVVYLDHSAKLANDGRLHVVVAENFWGNIASQLGGSRVNVTSIISDPNTDPHLYESSAKDGAAVSQADIAIKNGLGYDDFFDKLLSASPNANRTVVSATKVLGGTDGDNPHLWYDLERTNEMALAIEQAYEKKDPSHQNDYQRALAQFDSSLQPVLGEISQIKQRYSGAPVAYTERVPGYLLQDAGLSVQTPAGFASAIEDGNEPSPADNRAMEQLITDHKIRVLLYNVQATSPTTKHIQDLARQAGIPLVSVSETLPANEPTYQQWMLDQSKALLSALGG